MKKTLIIIILLGALMYATNPTQVEFEAYYSSKLEKIIEVEQEKSDGFFSKISSNMKNRAKKVSALNTVERKDYFIFSLYNANVLGTKVNYIGVFKKFFVISDSIEEKISEAGDDIKRELKKLEEELNN